MLASVVEWDAIWDVVLVSFIAGVGVTAIYAIAVLGVTRVLDMSRDGRPLEASAFGALAIISFAVVVAACAAGVIILAS